MSRFDLLFVVLDENDEPAARSSVVAFPIDQQKWTSGSPYIRSAPTDDAGAFSLEAPPGEYFLAAVRGRADTGERALARLAPAAVRVVVLSGGTVKQDIHIAP